MRSDHGLGQLEGDHAGGVEDAPLRLEWFGSGRVVGIEHRLVLAAGDENGSAQDDQRPQGSDVGVVERHELVEGPDRRKNGPGVVGGVSQHRRRRHGDVADEPRSGQVAEVDDAVRSQAGGVVDVGHHVVVGHVTVDRLHPKAIGNCRDPRGRSRSHLRHQSPKAVVREGVEKRGEDHGGLTQVPLDDSVETGVVEVGQCRRGARGQASEVGDDVRCEVAVAGQGCALDVCEGTQGEAAVAVDDLGDEVSLQRRDRNR